jgi:PPK2 family polyphosphate:nucleotide phosphotransferase
MKLKDIHDALLIEPGKKVKLKDYDPGWAITKDLKQLGKDAAKEQAQQYLSQNLEELSKAQELLYASDTYSVLVILQALDAAGKDGTIKHVMSGLNPQGCQVFSFKQPSAEELDHDFLWRCTKALPERGRIGIFNRSYYEEVLVVRVHQEFLAKEHLPPSLASEKSIWKDRFDDINNFEQHLSRNGTRILKFFLHVSKEEQKERFLERLNKPEKHWKFSPADIAERQHWDEYIDAYEAALSATSTDWAPWYIVPADHKWVTRAVVAGILTHAIRSLELEYPKVTPAQMAAIEEARKQLENE